MYISEERLSQIIHQEIVNEGWKDYVLASAIGLGSMLGGVNDVYGANNKEELVQYTDRVYDIEEQILNEFTDYNTKVGLYKELGSIYKKTQDKYALKVRHRLETMVYDDLVGRYKYSANRNDLNGLEDLLSIVKRFNRDCGISEGRMERLAFNIARKVNLLRTYNEADEY